MDELSILGNDVHSLTRDYDLARTGGWGKEAGVASLSIRPTPASFLFAFFFAGAPAEWNQEVG